MTFDTRRVTPSETPARKCGEPSSGHGQPPGSSSGGAVIAAILLQGVLAAADRLEAAAAQLDEPVGRPRALRDA